MAKLIGTAPFQTPTNADLGDLAYQDGDNAVIGPISISGNSVVLNGNELNALTVTIADDAVAELTFPTRKGGFLILGASVTTAFSQIGYSAFSFVDFGNSPAHAFIYQGSLVEVNTSSALTGTTGTDGRVTIGVAGTSGTLYIENRVGSNQTFSITLL